MKKQKPAVSKKLAARKPKAPAMPPMPMPGGMPGGMPMQDSDTDGMKKGGMCRYGKGGTVKGAGAAVRGTKFSEG